MENMVIKRSEAPWPFPDSEILLKGVESKK